MQSRFLKAALILMTGLLAVLPHRLTAQVSSATITGAIKDSTGGVIPHAKIVATEQATGTVTNAVTNDAGEYTLPLLKPGTYNLVVELKGFRRYEQKGLTLASGDHPTIDVPLSVGDYGQTVEVTATPPSSAPRTPTSARSSPVSFSKTFPSAAAPP